MIDYFFLTLFKVFNFKIMKMTKMSVPKLERFILEIKLEIRVEN